MAEENSIYFMQFVIGLQHGAWMALGKVQNPMTGKVEKDLNQVKAIIDTLLMFKEKTKNNLTKEEQELLDNSITEMQLNYVDEVKKELKEENKVNEGQEESGEDTTNPDNGQ